MSERATSRHENPKNLTRLPTKQRHIERILPWMLVAMVFAAGGGLWWWKYEYIATSGSTVAASSNLSG